MTSFKKHEEDLATLAWNSWYWPRYKQPSLLWFALFSLSPQCHGDLALDSSHHSCPVTFLVGEAVFSAATLLSETEKWRAPDIEFEEKQERAYSLVCRKTRQSCIFY